MFKAFKTDCTTFLTKYRIPFPEFLKALDGWIVISSLTEWFKTTAPPFSLARFVRADSRRRFTLPSTLETSTARNTVSLAAPASSEPVRCSSTLSSITGRKRSSETCSFTVTTRQKYFISARAAQGLSTTCTRLNITSSQSTSSWATAWRTSVEGRRWPGGRGLSSTPRWTSTLTGVTSSAKFETSGTTCAAKNLNSNGRYPQE